MEDEDMTTEEIVHYQCQDIEEDYDRMFAAGLQWTMDEEEAKDARDHALEYKRERDALKNQLEGLQKVHAMELTRMKAAYQAKMATLREERNRLAHYPVQCPIEKTVDSKPSLTIAEVVNLVKERFTKNGALEVSTLLFHLAGEKNILTNEVFKLIDGIVPAVINREHQTFNFNNTVQQVNVNSEVENKHQKK